MYKYTYLLSQSYRSDTSNLPQNVKSYVPTKKTVSHSTHHHQSKGFEKKSKLESKLINQNPRLSGYDKGEGQKQRKSIEKIEVKKYEPYDRSKYRTQASVYQTINNKPFDVSLKLQEISSKYCHESKKSLFIQNKKETQDDLKTKQRKFQTNKQRSYSGFAKINDQPDYVRPQPLANRILNEEQSLVSRSKIRSEIAVHLHKSKINKELAGTALPKKYNYEVEKQCIVTPNSDKDESSKSSATVAKLTSLQQRIKSTVEPYIHY